MVTHSLDSTHDCQSASVYMDLEEIWFNYLISQSCGCCICPTNELQQGWKQTSEFTPGFHTSLNKPSQMGKHCRDCLINHAKQVQPSIPWNYIHSGWFDDYNFHPTLLWEWTLGSCGFAMECLLLSRGIEYVSYQKTCNECLLFFCFRFTKHHQP